MATPVLDEKIEIHLNMFLELVNPKTKDVLDKVNSVREISISVMNSDYSEDTVLDIVNYGDHLKLIEKYKSPLGEINVVKVLDNVKPSQVLKMLFPDIFK